jgi:hypothetical protein
MQRCEFTCTDVFYRYIANCVRMSDEIGNRDVEMINTLFTLVLPIDIKYSRPRLLQSHYYCIKSVLPHIKLEVEVEKGGRESANFSAHFGHCILIYKQPALCVFSKQHMQAQVEDLYNWSILYDIYGCAWSSGK